MNQPTTPPLRPGPGPAPRERFAVFTGPDGRAWAQTWTRTGPGAPDLAHAVLPTPYPDPAAALAALGAINPGAVVEQLPADALDDALDQARAGGHFPGEGAPGCRHCQPTPTPTTSPATGPTGGALPVRAVPLPGPIEDLPLSAVTTAQAEAMLAQALSGVELGGFDREALDYLTATDTRVTVAVASLIRRAWAVGIQDAADDRQPEPELQLQPDAARLAQVADSYAGQYARAVGDDHSVGHRNMAVTAVVESAVTLTGSDGELAAAVRAVVAADQAQDAAALAGLRALPTPDLAGPQADDQHDDAGGDIGSVASRLVMAVCLVGIGVLLGVDHGPQVLAGLAWGVPVELAAIAAWWWRRTHGICRACGHLGSAGDPLTVLRRTRVHVRHLANIRASHRDSGLAARAARDDAAGGAR